MLPTIITNAGYYGNEGLIIDEDLGTDECLPAYRNPDEEQTLRDCRMREKLFLNDSY